MALVEAIRGKGPAEATKLRGLLVEKVNGCALCTCKIAGVPAPSPSPTPLVATAASIALTDLKFDSSSIFRSSSMRHGCNAAVFSATSDHPSCRDTPLAVKFLFNFHGTVAERTSTLQLRHQRDTMMMLALPPAGSLVRIRHLPPHDNLARFFASFPAHLPPALCKEAARRIDGDLLEGKTLAVVMQRYPMTLKEVQEKRRSLWTKNGRNHEMWNSFSAGLVEEIHKRCSRRLKKLPTSMYVNLKAQCILRGRELSKAIEHLRVPPLFLENEIIHLGRHLARGLHHMHAHGFAHRDFKPDNIMLRACAKREDFSRLCDSTPIIIDFGEAYDAGVVPNWQPLVADLCAGGQGVGGAAYYFPPEARPSLERPWVNFDKSDVYSLGQVLWDLMTDRTTVEISSTCYSPELRDLVQAMLHADKGIRPSISDALAQFELRWARLCSHCGHDHSQGRLVSCLSLPALPPISCTEDPFPLRPHWPPFL